MEKIQFFRKRSGKLVKFNPEKIRSAIERAIKEANALLPSPLDTTLPGFLTDKVLFLLDYEDGGFYVKPDSVGSRVPKLEDVQDAVEFAIQRRWEDRPRSFTDDKAKLLHDLYANYRKEREKARALLKVLNHKSEKMDVTDKSMLLLEGQRKNAVSGWDRNRLIQDLEKILPDADKAPVIAKRVERVILKSGLKTVSSDLIIEFVNNELMIEGIPTRMNSNRGYFIDKDFVDGLMYSKSKENSNIVGNNPEAINLALAEYTLKNWAFDNVFSEDVIHAHQFGQIYLHDLGYITRIYCSSHSIEYVKKYGLKGLINLNTVSKPAKSASVLTGHLNTYLASMQAYYAGALGLGYINVFYAPLVKGMTDAQIHQTAQELVFNGSQNAFSRGGQSLHPDELIWVKKNGRYQSMKIGEFVDSYIDNNPGAVRKTDNYEVFYTGLENIQAISFDKQTGKTLDKPIAYVARMPHKGKMYRVHTANGIVNVTGDHSLFTLKGKQEIVPTKANELKKKDFVVIPHRVHLEGEQEKVNILPYLPEEWLTVHGFDAFEAAVRKRGNPVDVLASVGATRYIMKDGKKLDRVRFTLAKHFLDVNHCLIGIKGDSQAYMPAQLPLTWELGYVAGMFCSEGHQTHKKVMISNKDLNILGKVKSSLDVMDYKWYRHNEGMAMGMTTDQVEVNGILGAFLKMSCADGKKKIIPDWLYTAPEECIQGFMEGFYDGEGNNRKNLPNQWSVSNTSTRVVSGINLLLLREGRESYIYETKHNNGWSDVYEIREIQHRKVNPFQEYTTEEGYATYGSRMPGNQIEAVEWLIKSDLSVSIIKKVEEYDYDGYVYDISVPGTEAFLGGIGNVFLKNTLFLDFNVHTGVPKTLKNIPAIGPGGKYMALNPSGNVVTLVERTVNGEHQLVEPTTGDDSDTIVLRDKDGKGWNDEKEGWHVMRYGDYTEESQRFAKALLTVWGEGDANGHIFEFPKCDFHVSEETFSDPNEKEVYDYACQIASKNGSIYFVFDRDSVSVASCCRLRVKIDEDLFAHPESIRSAGFQNVTINLPQASYRTKIEQGKGDPEIDSETWKLFTSQIDAAMDLAVKAHLQKKKHIANLMSGPNMPLWQIGKPANDGKPYVDLEKCVYIIGLIGLDDACRYLFGKSMHEDDKLTTWGLSVIAHMNLRAKEYTKEHGITFTLEESPAESAARRLARSDLAHFPEQAKGIVNGSEGNEYYTNSVHIPAYANVSLVERIVRQAMFHGMIDSGAITHAFIGEETPSAGAISEIVERTFRETQSAQITFSPEFTYCMDCGYGTRGIKKTCDMCGSSNVEAETRVVGYFSRISQWNKSKQFGELVDRHRGNYAVEEADK